MPAGEAGQLAFWRITGGREAGEIVTIAEGDDAVLLADEALAGLVRLIAAFDDPSTAYEPVPWPERLPRFSDYAHLARVAEWSDAEAGS